MSKTFSSLFLRGSGQALSPSKGRPWDSFTGVPHIYSASPGAGRWESTPESDPVTLTRMILSVPPELGEHEGA